MNGIVYFDFCNTLVSFETANEFVRYVISFEGTRSRFSSLIRNLISELHLLNIINSFHRSISVNKALWLYQLKGLSVECIHNYALSFYQERIKPALISPTIDKLIWYKDNNYKVIVVSGGYDPYIYIFSKEFSIDYICSRFLYKNGVFEGKIIGLDCMGVEKCNLIREYLYAHNIDCNNLEQIGYSDSSSDLPMLQMCERRFVVMRNAMLVPSWVSNLGADIVTY